MTKSGQFIRVAFIALLAACSSSHDESLYGGETNWLRECSDDAACGDYGSCMCSLCTEECMTSDDCPTGLVCKPVGSVLVSNACGGDVGHGLCSPECERDDDCGGDQACVDAACAPAAGIAGPDGGTRFSDAFAVAAVAPNADCTLTTENNFVPIGVFDVSDGAKTNTMACSNGYRVNLSVASLRSDLLHISGAEVHIQTLDRRAIVFDRGDEVLPNPFMFTSSQTLLPPDEPSEPTRGVYTVEAIPTVYAQQLDAFGDKQLLLDIRIFATDGQGTSISFSSFVYAVDICLGCLSICLMEDVTDLMLTPEDVYGDNCADNAGADGRICIDSDC